MIDSLDYCILSFFQDWIADPLQWSGVALEWQVRVACAISCLGCIGWSYLDLSLKKWFQLGVDGLIVMSSLSLVVYGIPGTLKVEESASRWRGLMWLGFTLIGLITDGLAGWNFKGLCGDLFAFGIMLRHYLIRCKPKPPAGNLKMASDTI